VNAIGNSSTIASQAPFNPALRLGADGGVGFGWKDIGIFKFGVEWRANDTWTWRAGYAHSENPIKSKDVMFNILAPGIIEDEFTGGVKYKWSDKIDLELSGMYAPENTVRGLELANVSNPTHAIEVSMYQFEITAGVTWKFGATSAPAALK
jgi:long-chain fatty acid transport protein